tara:strand:+ start:322730 stop:323104 length:375 start_codon:yes stop_codon:yes gene_type:complete
MDTVRILWRSKHPPTNKHKQLLEELYAGKKVILSPDANWIKHAHHVAEEFKTGEYDDLFVNASWTVLDAIAKCGTPPLIAILEESSEQDADLHDGRTHKQVVEIRRFKQLIIDHTKPQPYELKN